MSLSQWFSRLRRIDISDLDMNNMGSWPAAIKTLVGIMLMALVLVAGYSFHLKELRALLEQNQADEVALKAQLASKAVQAGNLETYTGQLAAMEASFDAMLAQLPSDTEVPGLLEDITRTGLGNGLVFEEIQLQPEVARPFYVELPIQITVTGNYHDLAAFASGVARLPRIVTLHDFRIKPVDPASPAPLRMSIVARTYRYSDQGAPQ